MFLAGNLSHLKNLVEWRGSMTPLRWHILRLCAPLLLASFLCSGLGNFSYAPAQTSLPHVEQLPGPKYAQAIDNGRTLLQALMLSSKVPGLSVAVAVDGDVVWAEGFGYSDLENRVPITALTKFRIGSVSKAITSTGLALLYEQGKIDLDAAPQKYVSYFPQKQWPMTVRQIGGHIGGVRTYKYADYDPYENEFVSARHYASVREAINIFQDSPLAYQPGTKYLYSTYGFVLLSGVIESASGQDYISYINDHVIEPLRLRNTMPDYNDAIVSYRSRFYMRKEDGKLVNAPYVDCSNKLAAGGWISTPSDLVRFGSGLVNGFLKEGTRKIWWTSQKTSDGKNTGYGIGFFVGQDFDGRRIVSHGGGSVGGTTAWVMFPEDDDVVIAMNVNMSVSPMSEPTAETIAEAFLNARHGSSSTATAMDLTGNYTFSVRGADGQELSGRFRLTRSKENYTGTVVPENEAQEPRRRAQDGSYGPLPLGEIPVALVSGAGEQVHVVGADSDGFIHMWFKLKGDGIDGRWIGRGVTGLLHGTRRINSKTD
jgi:serine beta-lactamase-like protein LACTB